MSDIRQTRRLVACPQCGKQVPWSAENPYRPFCSERCKLIDLGEWATESYRIAQSQDDLVNRDEE